MRVSRQSFAVAQYEGTMKPTKIFVKSVLYRIYSIVIAFLFFWVLFGEIKTATGYTLTLELIKVIQYCCFEMIWHQVPAPWLKVTIVKGRKLFKSLTKVGATPNKSLIQAFELLRPSTK